MNFICIEDETISIAVRICLDILIAIINVIVIIPVIAMRSLVRQIDLHLSITTTVILYFHMTVYMSNITKNVFCPLSAISARSNSMVLDFYDEGYSFVYCAVFCCIVYLQCFM